MAKKERMSSVFGEYTRKMAGDIGMAERMIGKYPPEEIRHYLAWGGITPLGQDILQEAEKAWSSRR